MPVRSEVLNWLEEAKADLRHSENSIGLGDYNWACFAAQQAVEKSLKALILHLLGTYPRGHDLIKLYSTVKEEVELSISVTDISRLSAYYTIARRVINEVSEAIRDP